MRCKLLIICILTFSECALIVRDGIVKVNPAERDNGDRTVFGWKSGIKDDPAYWKPLLRSIIKNTYRTLMTRGMKGCYIYSTDYETNEYFKRFTKNNYS